MAYHHGDLRNAIIAAARQRLRRGEEPLSIRELAREVGVSANAPYRHFADRDALLQAVAAAGYRDAAGLLAGSTGGAAAVADVWVALARRESRLVTLMTTPLGDRPSDDAELADAVGEWLGEVARAIEAEVGGDDPAAVLTAAVACWAGVHGLVALRGAGLLAGFDAWLQPDPVVLARRAVAAVG